MEVMTQGTPNPNALKFICDKTMRAEGKTTLTSKEEALTTPLVVDLFTLEGIEQLYFFENTITVNKMDEVPWEALANTIIKILKKKGPNHDPDFLVVSEQKKEVRDLSPELEEIDAILERTVRPALQGDGGDLEVVAMEDNILTVHYEGACGTCPSAISGTLMAIQSILRDEFNPDIEVVTV